MVLSELLVKGRKMSLSSVLSLETGELLKDGSFSNLGKLGFFTTSETLVFAESEKYFLKALENPLVSCVLVNPEINVVNDSGLLKGVLRVQDPHETFMELNQYLASQGFFYPLVDSSVHPSTRLASTAVIADKNVFIGENCLIEDHVVIQPNTLIGNNCIIRAGTIIGTPGYEVYQCKGMNKVAFHSGFVVIGDNVEIQACNCISRGLVPSRNTILASEVTTDNLVHIAHGAAIGSKTRIAANAMIAGSVTIGENVWIGPSASISNGIIIGNNAEITLGAVVTKNVPENGHVSGNFAIDHHKFLEFIKKIR